MHSIQRKLYQDHYHFRRLLHYLRAEVSAYSDEVEYSPRLSIILEALDYIQVYPNKWHHPIEDIIFSVLVEKGVAPSEVVDSVKNEHEILTAQTLRVNELFCAVANDTVVPVKELLDAAMQYIQLQSDHINAEDDIIYPLMRDKLDASDWEKIAAQCEYLDDPLFDEPLRREYENLYNSILEMESEQRQLEQR